MRAFLVIVVVIALLGVATLLWRSSSTSSGSGLEPKSVEHATTSSTATSLDAPSLIENNGTTKTKLPDRENTAALPKATPPPISAAPATTTPDEPAPVNRNPVGLLLTLHPITGGMDGIAAYHVETREDDRKARLIAIQEALDQYVDGDPKDPAEFEAYEALKTEALWLEKHPAPGS